MTAKHAAEKHLRRDTEIAGDTATVRFGADVLKSLSDLQAIVRNSTHFDKDLLMNVQELASGKSYSVRSAIANMAYIAQEVTQYINATGDERAKNILDNLLDQVNGFDKGSSDMTVVLPKRRQR